MKKLIIGLLAMLIIAPAVQAGDIVPPESPQVVYMQTVGADGTLQHGADAWAYAQSVSGWGPPGERMLIECNYPGLLLDYPGYWVKEAALSLHYIAEHGVALPGVRAYAITPAASGWLDGTYNASDWGSAAYYDLGWFVAGDTTFGPRTIDITAALQQASDDYKAWRIANPGADPNTEGKPFFVVRLQADDGSGEYEDGGPIYVFNEGDDGQPPWDPYGFSVTFTDIPEPSTIAIGLSSLMTLWLLRRKK